MFAERAKKIDSKENRDEETSREVALNMVEPCFVYMKGATLTSNMSALPGSNLTKGTPLNRYRSALFLNWPPASLMQCLY